MSALTHAADYSPFDALRKVRADGSEFWSARDLMPIMGYTQRNAWQHFLNPIERAMQSAKNQNRDLTSLFTRSGEKVTGGRPSQDFQLSRFAAYLVAMNGDPNKPEVAAAQAYFATQTRIAETTPAPSAIPTSYADALRAAADAHERAELESAKALQLTEQVAELAAPAKAWNNLAGARGHYSVAEAAKILSQDPAISIGRGRLFDYLHEAGWIFRHLGKRGGWEAYQTAVDADRLYERPATPFLNTKTGDYELPAPTIRVTVKGIQKLQALLTGQVAA